MAKTLIIAEQSEIIRKGLVHLVGNLGLFKNIREVNCASALHDAVNHFQPQVIIMNPSMLSTLGIDELRNMNDSEPGLRIAAIVYSFFDDELLSRFDEVIMVNDNRHKIKKRLEALLDKDIEKQENKPEETLSAREMDVLRLLVKGMSNKEISDKLFISTHTVISHRKNITQKLNIKSVAGLTVYAILNEIISIDDVQ